ncbi:Ribosomal RNA small subunit methyltransferase H 2 [Bienertia sinuspersici]
MPPKTASRNDSFLGEIGRGLQSRRTSKQHQPSRFAREKPLSPQANQGSNLKDKGVKVENSIRPPHSDLPFEFVKNANNEFVVQTKYSGSQKQSSKEEELVKYMSKVPGFLQSGEMLQDNSALNFGVLDWGRLEQWTHKRDKTSVSETVTRPATGSCSSTKAKTQGSACTGGRNSAHNADISPVVKPLSGKVLKSTELQTSSTGYIFEKQQTCKEDTSRVRDAVKFKSAKSKQKYLDHGSSRLLTAENSSSNLSNYDHGSSRLPTVGKSSSNLSSCDHGSTKDNKLDDALKCSENTVNLKLDTPHEPSSGKQDSIVLLLPKDFSASENSEMLHRAKAPLDDKSTEQNWGSFSDIFSIDEIHSDESVSDIPHSCPVTAETENELDLKLDNLIKDQGIENPVNASDMALHSTSKNLEAATSTYMNPKAISGPDQSVQRNSAEMPGDLLRHKRFSFGMPKLTKSLSFKEGSLQPPPSSSYVTAKSGPAKPECSETGNSSNKANNNGRAKASPLRRLLDPLLKSKVANQCSEQLNDLRMKPPIPPVNVPEAERHKASAIKALLHFTVKSGLPLFKFVVEENNEIFASTVRSLSTLEKADISWLFTFYSVQRVRKKSSGWKNQKVKPCGFGYNVVGQMKVSEPRFPSWCNQNPEGKHMVKESVLYNVDVSKTDAATSEFKTSRELVAVVVNLDDSFSEFEHEKLGRVVAILPGGDHSLPHDGVPSSLITRWRSGGACDCGGWDIGCKLRILTDKRQHHKFLQFECDLYDQGEAKQCKPFFSLIPLRDGLFSVEFDAQISSLQAFSISVAIINSWKPAHSVDATDQVESKPSMSIKSEAPEKHAPHPPLSPVGRV